MRAHFFFFEGVRKRAWMMQQRGGHAKKCKCLAENAESTGESWRPRDACFVRQGGGRSRESEDGFESESKKGKV